MMQEKELSNDGGNGSSERPALRRPRPSALGWPPMALAALVWVVAWGGGCEGCPEKDREADRVPDADVGPDVVTDVLPEADVEPDVPPEADAELDVLPEADVEADVPVEADAELDVLPEADIAAPTNTLVVLTSDYATRGGLSLIDLDLAGRVTQVVVDAAAVHHDSMLPCVPAGTGEQIFHVVERRDSDRVRRFRLTGTGLQEIGALDLEDGTNPQDAVPLSVGQLAVPLYERNTLAFVAGDLSAVQQTVDLSALADADGLCEMHRGVEWNGRLYVSVQRLGRPAWTPTGPGLLAAVRLAQAGGSHELLDMDPATPGVQGVVLAGENPVGPVRLMGQGTAARLLVATVGRYGQTDGGLVTVTDPASGTPSSFVVTEAALGGDIGDWVILEGDRGFAVATANFAEDRLMRFNARTGEVSPQPVLVSAGFTLAALADAGGGLLAVGDRGGGGASAGVRLFSAETGQESTQAPVDVGLPPVAVCRL